MKVLVDILVAIVGIEHIGIMLLEMFGNYRTQAKSFDLPLDFTHQPKVRILLANQGIYNGMLGLLIILTFWVFPSTIRFTVWLLLMIFVVVVALYGGLTATKKIWVIQLLPALITLICIWTVI